jgi:hypothetical protein
MPYGPELLKIPRNYAESPCHIFSKFPSTLYSIIMFYLFKGTVSRDVSRDEAVE